MKRRYGYQTNKKNFQAVDPGILRENFELKLRHLDEVLPKLSDLFKSAKEETTVESLIESLMRSVSFRFLQI